MRAVRHHCDIPWVVLYIERWLTAPMQSADGQNGTPEIMNTDQGSQFTSTAFTDLLKHQNIRISMDGKGAWRDNVFVERLWRSVKYEDVYLHGYTTVADVQNGLDRYFRFYNARRPHQSHEGLTPDRVYFKNQVAVLHPRPLGNKVSDVIARHSQ